MDYRMDRIKKGSLVYYTCQDMQTPHLFTTKFGGVSRGIYDSLNLRFNSTDNRKNVEKNYQILADLFGVPMERLTLTKQVHRDGVHAVREAEIGMGIAQPMSWETDAIVTNLPNVPLCGFYADCVVTLLHDPVSRSIGVCHSGWRGTANGILAKTVQTMQQEYGALPQNITAVIGPSIHPCCFETDEDVPTAMRQQMGNRVERFITYRKPKWYIDLQGINCQHLQHAGVRKIVDSGLCTKCHSDEFWSHRVTQGNRGVQAGIIMLKEENK